MTTVTSSPCSCEVTLLFPKMLCNFEKGPGVLSTTYFKFKVVIQKAKKYLWNVYLFGFEQFITCRFNCFQFSNQFVVAHD